MEQAETPLYQRLIFLLNTLAQGNQSELARRIGVASGVIGDMLGKRRNKPSFDVLVKMASAFPQLRMEWLLLGEGEMLKSEEASKNNSVSSSATGHLHVVQEEKPPVYGNPNLRVLTVQVGADGDENIEVVGARAAAGYAQGGFHQPDFIEQLPSFRLPDPAYRNATFRCFQVSGDSMQPTIHPGDWIICKYVEQWDRDVRDNRVYVVVLPETVVVKRLLNRINSRGELSLLSDNAAYGIQFVDPADVREIWEAVGKLSRQFVNPRFDVSTELARHGADIAELFALVKQLKEGKG